MEGWVDYSNTDDLIQLDRLNEASGENLRFIQGGLSSHLYCRCMRFV